MAEIISPNSRIFTDLQSEIQSGFEGGTLKTGKDIGDYIRSKGHTVDAYNKAEAEYEAGPDLKANPPGVALTRMGADLLGRFGEGVESVSEAVAPETTQKIRDKIQDNIPDWMEKTRQEMFFPASGNIIEEGAKEIAPYIATAIPIGKVITAGGKLAGLVATTARQKVAKGLVSYATAATVIEKPENNPFNIASDMMVKDEDGNNVGTVGKIVENLKINPDDNIYAQYLKAFVNNLALESAFTGTGLISLKALKSKTTKEIVDYATKGTVKVVDKVVPTALKDAAKVASNRVSRAYYEYGTTRMGLNDEALELIIEKKGAAKKAITESSILEKEFNKNMNIEIPKKVRTDKTIESINSALAGDKKAMMNLEVFAPKVANTVNKMRLTIDKLSKTVRDEVVEGDLKAVVNKNLNVYLNRSYRIFDDPGYLNNIPPKAKEGALRYFKGLKGKNKKPLLNDEEIKEVYKHYTEGMIKGERGAFIKGVSNYGNQVLRKKKDIAIPIRNLWGEVKQADKNYVNTYGKLAGIIAESKFRKEIVKAALDAKKASKKSIKGFSQIAEPVLGDKDSFLKASNIGLGGIKVNVNNPLKDIFLDPSWKKAIEQGTEVNLKTDSKILNGILKTWMSLKAGSQAAKTIYSVPTHVRNFMGNIFIATANGVNPFKLRAASKDIAKRYTGKQSKADLEELARLQELGVVDSSVTAEVLKATASSGLKTSSKNVVVNNKAVRSTKWVNKKVLQAYEAEDNIFKIAVYNTLKRRYKKAMPNKTTAEIERFTARRVRDTMPNYNLVPKAIKSLRYVPFGNFVAFPAEMARNSKNLLKYAWQDISGSTAKKMGVTDPEGIARLRTSGLKSLAGMTTVALGVDQLAEGTKAVYNISDTQAEALENLVPEWEQGTNKIFTGPIEKDKKGNWKVKYINMGQIDPYSYIKEPVTILTKAIINGEEYNEETVDKMYGDAIKKIVSPFIDPSMIASNVYKELTNDYAVQGEGVAPKLLRAAEKSFIPGTAAFIVKKLEFNKSRKKYGEGNEVNKRGFPMNEGSVSGAAFLGAKESELNISAGISYKLRPLINNIMTSKRLYTNKFSTFNGVPEEEIVDSYMESQNIKHKNMQLLRNAIQSYQDAGLSTSDIVLALKDKGMSGKQFSTLVYMTDINKFIPDYINKNDVLKARKAGVNIPFDDLTYLYKQYNNLEID